MDVKKEKGPDSYLLFRVTDKVIKEYFKKIDEFLKQRSSLYVLIIEKGRLKNLL